MPKKQRLPNKPSDLIEVAMNDLNSLERSRKYIINMHTWHSPEYGSGGKTGRCYICLAGSVMAKTLGADIEGDLGPCDFSTNIAKKLNALDEFRVGGVGTGLYAMDIFIDLESLKEEYDIPPYSENRTEFKLKMRKMIRDLRAEGL